MSGICHFFGRKIVKKLFENTKEKNEYIFLLNFFFVIVEECRIKIQSTFLHDGTNINNHKQEFRYGKKPFSLVF